MPIFRPQAQNIPSSGIRRAWGWRIVPELGDSPGLGVGGCSALGDSLRREDCSDLGGSPGLGVEDCSELGDLPGLQVGGCSALGDSLHWEDCSELGGSPGLGVGDCSALGDSPGEHVASPVAYRESPLGEPLGFAPE